MSLDDRPVAVVSGASRGVGKGIALALGRRGFTVYLAGRGGTRQDGEAELPGTLEESASEIDALGGRGIPVVCDMANDENIRRLFARVRNETGGLDVLVNNAAFLHDAMALSAPFWEKPAALADIISVGLRCHYIALCHAVPLMVGRAGSLAVNVSFFGHAQIHDPAYIASKAGLDAMAAGAAASLAREGITIVSLWPGIVVTERLQQALDQLPGLAEQLPVPETPEFVGDTVTALYDDPLLPSFNGRTLITAELAGHYGLVGTGAAQPVSLRGSFGFPHPENDFNYSGSSPVNVSPGAARSKQLMGDTGTVTKGVAV